MPRIIRCSLVQATNAESPASPLDKIKQVMLDKHVAMIRKAAAGGAQIICLQEIFYGPYFCAEQSTRWYDFTEPIPGGSTTKLMQKLAAELRVALDSAGAIPHHDDQLVVAVQTDHQLPGGLGQVDDDSTGAAAELQDRAAALGHQLLPERQIRLVATALHVVPDNPLLRAHFQ